MRRLLIQYIIEKDVKAFFKYKWWMAGLISMNLADIFILAIVFNNMVRKFQYFNFVLPGIVIAALFASSFTIGREVSIEIRRRIHHYILSLPFRDWELIWGRMIAGGIRGLIYSTPLLLLAIVLSPLPNVILLIYIPPLLFLLSIGIGALAIFLASVIRNFDAYITARGLLYFILIFCSTVFYPIEIFKKLPEPIYIIASYNPVSHGADIMRTILYKGLVPIENIVPLFTFSIIFAVVGASLYAIAIRKY